MISLLITLIVVGVILSILYWAILQVPFFGPFAWVIRVIFALIVVIVLADLFLGGGLGGNGLHLGNLR